MAYKTWFAGETNNASGAFVRQGNHFTAPFGAGEGELPIEAGRYRLIWSAACPWATRQMIVRSLLGLEKVLSVGLVDPIRPAKEYSDWAFSLDPGAVDPVLKVKYLSDLYLASDPNYQGRFTVPAIVDIPSGTVVNNDYFNLSYYWETVWQDFHKPDAPDLFPEKLRQDIQELNSIIFHDVNNGVYKAGFARGQAAYEAAYHRVFKRLDWLDGRLSTQRYLFGDSITDSDIRLWVSLARFDAAYYNAFRVNRNRLTDFPHLWAYARDLYQIPAFGENTHFDHIKAHYHVCCDPGNVFGIVPKGPDAAAWKIAHGREKLAIHPA
ncbi:glutathione S-transferase family protein [Treponema primitia]|uniref:glutathione S-transferase family protein n=1 Tax=Treponema primitia TaxID=88058 RepID=UPI00025558CB|nr:glutathione S-transferase C-terminal domain-containing protein [Treponema primitia]